MRKMKRFFAMLLCMCTLATVTACGGNNATQTNESGKKDSITVSLGGNVTTLDPVSSNLAVNQMLGNVCMSTLVDFDENWNVVPNLAESWTISDDALTYTFKLRDDIKFHSGDTMTAEDVVFSVNRCMESSFTQTDWQYCDGAEALNDSEVNIYLNTPYTAFLAIMAKTLFIHNQSYYEEYLAAGHTDEEYQMNIDGTGPYKFVSYEDGVSIEFEAFSDFYKGEPAIKHWYGKIITDDNARAMAIEAGDIDLIEPHTTVPSSNMELLKSLDNIIVEKTDFEKVGSIVINNEIEPFNNKLVRKALAYAIDYDWLIEVTAMAMRLLPNALILVIRRWASLLRIPSRTTPMTLKRPRICWPRLVIPMEKESRRLWPLLPKIVRASWKLFRHVGRNWESMLSSISWNLELFLARSEAATLQ